jgi:hypothetical protein
MVADPEWKIYRSCREICDGRTRRDLLEIQIQIQNGRYLRRYGEMQGRYKEIENGISREDTRRSRMRNSMEIQGDLREIQRRNREIRNGRYKEIWRRYGEIQGRYREIDDGIFKVGTG